MKDTTSISVEKPIKWYNQLVKIDFKKLFTALGKAIFLSSALDPRGGFKELIDSFNAFDFKKDASSLAYSLLIKSMANAAHDLAFENKDRFDQKHIDNEKLYDDQDYVDFLEGLNKVLESKSFSIGLDTFNNPRDLPFLNDFRDYFKKWMTHFGINEQEAQNIANRLPAYFVLGLNEEWRSNPTSYEILKQKAETPFTQAAKRELEWERYHSFLQKQVEESVFGESFSLKQIFIPLRAYYLENIEDKQRHDVDMVENIDKHKSNRIPFFVKDELDKWLKIKEVHQAIKFISGGPGSGKSSLSKMWCAEVASTNELRVLFVPLHLFDLQSDIIDSVGKFVSTNRDIVFDFNPLSQKESSDKILVVFDGLDELTQQGPYATEVAQNFIRALESFNQQINRDGYIHALFLVTGRELAIQSNTNQFRKNEHILFLLPYFIDKKEYTNKETSSYLKKFEPIISIDQRDEWWQKFGTLKGRNYNKLPEELSLEKLNEITSQPLLNYLVALSLERKKVKFSKDINLNDIYRDLIEAVYDRAYESHGSHKLIGDLCLMDILEHTDPLNRRQKTTKRSIV